MIIKPDFLYCSAVAAYAAEMLAACLANIQKRSDNQVRHRALNLGS